MVFKEKYTAYENEIEKLNFKLIEKASIVCAPSPD
jgi:hypothetical protein